MRIDVFDFGVGNLHSLSKALSRHSADVRIVRDADTLDDADAIVLPGVGAFGAAADALSPQRERIRAALEAGVPCLGICLGMQLLFDRSEEGRGIGLGVVPGSVRRLHASRRPQMGWNAVETAPDPLFNGVDALIAYYANSFVAEPLRDRDVIAWSEYDGDRFPAAIRHGSTWGVQFHPEKSGKPGLRIVDNFLEQVR